MFLKCLSSRFALTAFSAVLLLGANSTSAMVKAPLEGAPASAQYLKVHVAQDDIASGAQAFVEDVSSRGIGFLSNETLSEAERRSEFKGLLEDNFDMKTIARFALGRYWKSIQDSQKSEYLRLFKKMIVSVYSDRFSQYNGQELTVMGTRAEGKADAIVTSKILSPQGSNIQIDWRVRSKNGGYKVVDIVVEGVSMALTQRSDFASVIQRGGGNVDVLLEHLRVQ